MSMHFHLRSGRNGFLGALNGALLAPLLRPAPPPDVIDLDFPLDWFRLPRIPVASSTDPAARAVLAAISREERIGFLYHGGRAPGARREVAPAILFRLDGFPHCYFTGFCLLRQACRTFRLDRCSGLG